MTPDQLAEIKARAEKATGGPWMVGDPYHIQSAAMCECMEHSGPLVWEGVRDINGTDMETHIHKRLETWEDTSVYSDTLPYVPLVALSTNEYHDLSPEDAEFIAHARTDIPRLVDEVERLRATIERVKAVREIHVSSLACGNPRHTNPEALCPECTEFCVVCGDAPPCPTIRALDERLGS